MTKYGDEKRKSKKFIPISNEISVVGAGLVPARRQAATRAAPTKNRKLMGEEYICFSTTNTQK